MNKLRWRRAEATDAAALVAMFSAEQQQDPTISVPSVSQIEHTLQRVLSTPQGDVTVVFNPANQLVAMGLMTVLPEQEGLLAHARGHVHVSYRQQGIGTQILQWTVEQAMAIRNQFAPTQSLQLVTTCRGNMRDRIKLFEAHRMQPARYSIQMQRSLTPPLPTRKLPHGVDVRLWSEDQDDALRRAFNLAFEAHWGVAHFSAERWRQRFIDTPHFQANLTYLAYDENDLIGFCLTEQHHERNAQIGLQEAWMDAIGVVPKWRGQGLASGLMCHAMWAYVDQGFTHAGLDVDAQNPTHAVVLYQKLGFNELRREIIYAMQLI